MRKKDLIRKNLVENACFEKEIMSSANNAFVVRSFYSFTSKDNLYLVMEWISGGDTASLLKSMGSLNEDVARQYIAETILALEWCHSQVTHPCKWWALAPCYLNFCLQSPVAMQHLARWSPHRCLHC